MSTGGKKSLALTFPNVLIYQFLSYYNLCCLTITQLSKTKKTYLESGK